MYLQRVIWSAVFHLGALAFQLGEKVISFGREKKISIGRRFFHISYFVWANNFDTFGTSSVSQINVSCPLFTIPLSWSFIGKKFSSLLVNTEMLLSVSWTSALVFGNAGSSLRRSRYTASAMFFKSLLCRWH